MFKKRRNTFEALKSSALMGQAEAQYTLGKLYEYGDSEHLRNLNLAHRWYQKAAAQGHRDARYRLSLLQAIIRTGDSSSDPAENSEAVKVEEQRNNS